VSWEDYVKPDDETVEKFIRRLANATMYDSRDTGIVITEYWKAEAQLWVREFEKPGDPDYDDPCPTCGN
jgi:hypothetical protein